MCIRDRYEAYTLPPEITFGTLITTNQGIADPDFPQTYLIKEGDRASLSFSTSDRISPSSDNSSQTSLRIFSDNGTEIGMASITEKQGENDGLNWIANFSSLVIDR